MKSLKYKNTLIFLHVPKVAGTTLMQILRRQFPANTEHNIYTRSIGHLEDLKNLSKEEISKLRLVHAHSPLVPHTFLVQGCDYITMLRNPVERVISQYYFILFSSESSVDGFRKDMTLRDYVESGAAIVNNMHVRLLCGIATPFTFDVGEPLPTNALEIAKENLKKHFKVVGITERFDESLLILQKSFGWKNVYYSRQYVSKKRLSQDEISPDILSIIEENNKLDKKLYEFAQSLLHESIEEYGPSFGKDLTHFKTRNRFISKLFRCREFFVILKNKISVFLPSIIKKPIKYILTRIH